MSETSGQILSIAKFQRTRSTRHWLSIIIVAVACASCAEKPAVDSRKAESPVTSRTEVVPAGAETTKVSEGKGDFSKFTHGDETHARLPCLLCHVRDSDATLPKVPGHAPCAGCHAKEFANTGSLICSICHTDAQAGTVKPFPKLKNFNVRFDHAGHIGTGRSSSQCATCHKAKLGGVSLSIPGGLSGHLTCFQCHGPRALGRDGQDIASCSTCHSLAGYARTPDSSKAYGISFSHAKHGAGKKLNCGSCHSIRAGMPQRRQVMSPVPVMHASAGRAQSCVSCHNDKRAFGVANPSDCKRCHQGVNWGM